MKYLWHLGTSKWDKVMEKLEDGPIKSFSKIHEKFLGKRNTLAKRGGSLAKRKKTL